MVFFNHTALLLSGIPQVLPSQDRALTWACSACFHTLALAVASVAAVSLREAPPAPAPVVHLEILLTDVQQEAEQATATDSPAQTDTTTLQETIALTEDSSPIVPTSSPSMVRRTTQRITAETPPSQTTDRPTEISDQFPVESSESIEHPSELSASVSEPDPLTPPSPAEAVEQADLTTAASSPSEPIVENPVDHTEPSSQPEASFSPPTDPTPPTSMSGSETDAIDSPAAPPAETIAMHHPAIAQSISARSQYAWLMDLLRRRIISLQAYPHLARMQGWEGVVVVKTTINSDGDLVDAVVTKSSGYGALDEDAVRLMHRVCPVHLTQDLGKSKIAVMIPIRYRLDGFEK
ncbi:MAG: TonB family protein [Nitrospira sp.]|nr:TonB family protein [Nitrospira sp.]